MKTHVESRPSGSPGKDDPAAASVTSYCDLVMKGGITSGVIYPKLISQLAAKYTFKNIGGTSAGAIAAGGCAAAEYGRSHGNGEAFRDLEGLPEFLSKKTEPSGRSKLFTLFQPTDALRSHFEVLVEALNLKPEAAAKRVVMALLKMHLALVFSGLVVGTLLLWPMVRALAPGASGVATLGVAGASVVLALLAAFLGAMLAARGPLAMAGALILAAAAVVVIVRRVLGVDLAWWTAGAALAMVVFALLVLAVVLLLVVYRFGTTLLRGLHANGYGICSGQSTNSGSGALPGLTNWLAQYFNDLAGLPSGHHPLTFGDLWGTTDWKEPRQVNLEVMTSAISQQMVYGIPFREGTPRFYYDVEEWSKLFPSTVIEWLEKAQKATPEGDGSEPLPAGASVISAAGKALRVLPRRADLPVVVAVRMSLSFPILLSAVPLYAIDWGRTENQQKKKQLEAAAKGGSPTAESVVATRVWFSDGGIGSNMPLHMFDALLPGHPTFAVNLKPPHPDYPIVEPECADNNGGRIYLPDSNVGGRLRYWPEPADSKPVGGLIAFLSGIVDTMQNWRDEILFPYPGFRDRIVQISQRPTEGGLNLDMPPDSIANLAGAGAMAAGRLINRFHPLGTEAGRGWTNHQTVRLGTFLGTMQPGSAALQPSLASGTWAALLPNINGYRVADRSLATSFLLELGKIGALGAGTGVSLERGALKPLAQIRITPKI